MTTRNDLPDNSRKAMIALLNARLVDAIDLRLAIKQAHWNVKGPNFIALHELFDRVYAATGDYVDELAERAVQLGGTAYGTVRMAAAASKLKEYPADLTSWAEHVAALSDALAAFGKSVRAAIDLADEKGDANTADLFTEISRGVDKWLWFVEAYLEK